MISAALTLASGCGLSACIYEGEDRCPDKIPFTIAPDWSEAPNASPEGMAYIFFPADGSPLWRFDFPGRAGGQVSMNAGDYCFLSYNDDTYNIIFRGDNRYYTCEAYTPAADLLGGIPASLWGRQLPDSKDEKVVESPDMLWGCAYCNFSLQFDGVRYNPSPVDAGDTETEFSPEAVLTALQRPLTAHYSYRIENVENLSGVKSMSAALSGMAGSMFLASRKQSSYPSTISVKASAGDATTIAGTFNTFGIPPKPSAGNILRLFVVIKDNRRFCYEFDVTDQIRSAPDPMNVSLLLRGLTLEIPEDDDGTGFDVNVDGWTTVIVNING